MGKNLKQKFVVVIAILWTCVLGSAASVWAKATAPTTSPLTLTRDMLVLEDAAVLDASCTLSPNDPYERPHRISKGSKKYGNECVDTDRFRYSEILNQNKSEIVFSNYRHLDEYWTATLSLNAVVDQVFFHVVRFEAISGVIAAHTQLRIKFSNQSPLKMVSQLDPQKTTEVFDLVISFEAGRPVNVPYNFALGAVDNYVSMARILSGHQRLAESTENITEQYELEIPQEEKLHIVLLGIEKSSRDGFSRFYNTVSENCTTDAFGILDALSSMQGRAEPFLTVLSNDPVAGPSIRALQERKILKARFSDLDEELTKGISSYKPETSINSTSSGFLPYVKDHPYSLVISSPEEGLLSAEQLQAVQEIKALTYEAVPRALHLVGSSLMLAQGDSRDFLFTFLKEASSSLEKRIQKINSSLPDQAVEVVAYLVPWQGGGQKVNLNTVSSIQARLPFDFYQISHKDIGLVSAGITRATHTQSIPEFGLQAYAIALQFYLKKDAWSVSMQVLGGLNERNETLDVANPQVNISSFIIPEAPRRSEQPVVLLNVTLTPQDKSVPQFNMEFGSFGGLKARMQPKAYGQISIMNSGFCESRLAVTPRLEGKFADEATGYSVVDYIFEGKFVSFNIFKVNMDLETQRITDMDIRFNFYILGLPISCLSQDSVNDSFKQSANEQIEQMVKSLQSSDATSLVTPIVDKVLSNN